MNSRRQELLSLIAELSDRYPSMRLGQLISNLASWAPDEPNIWDATDDELIAAAESHLSQHASHTAKQ
jgi:hypothetical protein